MTIIRLAGVLVLFLPSLAVADDFERGMTALSKGDFDKAITCFTAHIRSNPKDAAGFNHRGYAYARKKEYNRAIRDYSEAIRLDPNNYSSFSGRGFAYHSKKEYDQAIKDYSKALRLEPRQSSVFIARGNAHLAKKEYDKAIGDYSDAMALDPKDTVAVSNRGLTYFCKKEYDRAINDYSRAVWLDPKNAFAHTGLAWVLATCPNGKVRDGKKAVEHATRACELSGWKGSDYLDTLAAAYAESGNFKEAIKWQKKALDLDIEGKEEAEKRPKKARKRLKLYEEGKPYRDE
jgi:tetratricopeptide (TPR) repeat protein